MTFSEQLPRVAGLRRRLSRFAWLLPILASPLVALQTPPFVLRPAQAVARSSLPYLAVVDPVAMRFAPPPPDIAVEPRPAAAAPPVPGGPQEEIAASNHQAQVSPARESGAAANSDMPPIDYTSPVAEPRPAAEAESNQPPPAPVTLLRDDLRREVRPEDVLPLFQPPGSGLILAVPPSVAPVGPPPPPSSATYRQR